MQTTSTRWGGEGLNGENLSWTSILKQSEEEREAIAEAERKAKKRRLMAMGLAGEDPEFIYTISSITCCRYEAVSDQGPV